jgi:hypothetical protein
MFTFSFSSEAEASTLLDQPGSGFRRGLSVGLQYRQTQAIAASAARRSRRQVVSAEKSTRD